MSGLGGSPEPPVQRRRVSAYAVLRRGTATGEELLLTRMSARTRIPGRWTLPGGGIDHGEDPRDAVRREVFEETGLHVVPGAVVDVGSTRNVGRRDGVGPVEDYHGIHLIFDAALEPASVGVDPHVTEPDSSTDLARWVPFEELADLPLLNAAALVVRRLEEGSA